MYPHFLNKQTIAKPVFAKEAEKENNLLPQNTKKLTQIIEEAILSEENSKAFFENLSKSLSNEDKEIVSSIILDETKHIKLLNYIYTQLTENKPIITRNTKQTINNNLSENLSIGILEKAENSKLYRELASSSSIAEIKELFFEIMTDEMVHMTLLNYLYNKYSQN